MAGLFPTSSIVTMLLVAMISAADAGLPKRLTTSQREACLSRGDQVVITGLMGHEDCVPTMPDAGKACTDHSQCKAGCFVDPGSRQTTGKKIIGTCAATKFPGCRPGVIKGKTVGGDICE